MANSKIGTVRKNKLGKRVPLTEWMRGIVLAELIPRFGRACWYCGVELGEREIHIDHIQPLSGGGKDSIENLALSCMSCNRAKWDMQLIEFFDWVKRIRGLYKFPAKKAFEHLEAFCDHPNLTERRKSDKNSANGRDNGGKGGSNT